jgi:hypothetical protein
MSDADWDYAIETRLRIDSHGLLHAHEPIDPLSRQLIKGKNQSAVSMALNQIIIPAIQTVAKKSVVSHFKGKIRSAVLAEIKKYAFFLRDEMVRRAVASGYLVTTVAVGAEKTAAAAAAAENLFAWRLLGIVTGPLMTYLSTTTPLACDGVSDAVINTVPESGGLGCKPRYELNRTTMNFIYNFPEKTRRQYLARQDVCMFYQTLRNRYYTVPRFRQLRCESSRITVKGTDAVGKSVELKIILGRTATATSAIQSHAQKLYLKENEAVAADFDISETGLITHASDPKNALLSIRLYAQEAIQCCLEGRHDPALMRNCQKLFPGAEGL